MSRVLPILFNTEMVRAILDGRKTVTRRVMKPQPLFYTGRKYIFADDVCPKKWKGCDNIIETYQYQVGDILYVRETYKRNIDGYHGIDFGGYIYKADCTVWWKDLYNPWHPSIHMPKEAARIWLKVTDVRVEWLQDITEGQAQVEGAVRCYEKIRPDEDAPVIYRSEDGRGYYTLGFKAIWNSTIKKSDLGRYGWDANPWVWVIEFERCEKPKEV